MHRIASFLLTGPAEGGTGHCQGLYNTLEFISMLKPDQGIVLHCWLAQRPWFLVLLLHLIHKRNVLRHPVEAWKHEHSYSTYNIFSIHTHKSYSSTSLFKRITLWLFTEIFESTALSSLHLGPFVSKIKFTWIQACQDMRHPPTHHFESRKD